MHVLQKYRVDFCQVLSFCIRQIGDVGDAIRTQLPSHEARRQSHFLPAVWGAWVRVSRKLLVWGESCLHLPCHMTQSERTITRSRVNNACSFHKSKLNFSHTCLKYCFEIPVRFTLFQSNLTYPSITLWASFGKRSFVLLYRKAEIKVSAKKVRSWLKM